MEAITSTEAAAVTLMLFAVSKTSLLLLERTDKLLPEGRGAAFNRLTVVAPFTALTVTVVSAPASFAITKPITTLVVDAGAV
jgi:hypothetical protein